MRENIRYKEQKKRGAKRREDLSKKQRVYMQFLLQSGNTREAAKEAGISLATAYRWTNEPYFATELIDARDRLFYESLATLKTGVKSAVDCLLEIIEDEHATRTVKVRAADVVLSRSLDLHLMQRLEARLIQMEKIVLSDNEIDVHVRQRSSNLVDLEGIAPVYEQSIAAISKNG